MNQQVKWESEIPWIYFANLNIEPLINSLIEPIDFINDDIKSDLSRHEKLAFDEKCKNQNPTGAIGGMSKNYLNPIA